SVWARADRKRTAQVSASLDQADYRNVGLSSPVNLGTDWKQFKFKFTANRTVAAHTRLLFALGSAGGTVDLAGLSVRSGAEGGAAREAALQEGAVPLGRMVDGPAGRDWVACLMAVERGYLETMRDFVKRELGAKANVVCSQAGFGRIGGMYRERKSDFADVHGYWGHPRFPNKDWDMADWTIHNKAMTREV